MAGSDISPSQWASSLLHRLGIQQTPGAVTALVGWAKAEGGHWNNQAKFNPLNTTQPEPGAGNTGSQGNIKVYKNWDQGLQATVETLRNGRYDGILGALKQGNPEAVANAIGKTPWGTSGSLVRDTILGTKTIRGAQPIAGGAGGLAARPTAAPASSAPPAAAAVSDSGGQALASLLTQIGKPVDQGPRPSMGIATPVFAAGAPAPAGARLVQSAGVGQSASPGAALADALSQIKQLGAAGPGAGQTPTQADAASFNPSNGSTPAPKAVRTGKFKPGDPVVGGTSVGGQHETMGLAGYPARDFFAPAGSQAVAPVSGTVVRLSGHNPADGPTNGPHGPLGYSIYIKGSDGHTYFLTHMGTRSVKPGQHVKAGEAIGTVANYDKYGTPSHIHMGVH